MKFFKRSLMIILVLILLFGVGNAFAGDLNDSNSTIEQANEIIDDDSIVSQDSDEIEVETWEDIQYYASLKDKNYALKLKENTNYYPKNVASSDNQIIFNNNVTIIGSDGAYIGDSSPNPRNITYTAMKVPDNSGVGIAFKGVTFKWISTSYQPDGIFLQMGGNAINYFNDCYFTQTSTDLGHSALLHIKLGDAIITNCSFINCTNDYGCLSIYNPDDDPTELCTLARMNVTDSYFEGNYARTAPGCINNCGILVVRNSTFYKNSAFWWAGAIHTTGGANTTLYDSLFVENVAGWNGGALYTYSYLQVFNTTFISNNCTTNNGGGAIGACKFQHAPYIYVQDSVFKYNENTCWGVNELSSGTGRGGAISIMDEGGLEVRNSTFIKNSASYGTAICAIAAGSYGSPNVVIVGNRFINHTRVGDVLDIRLEPSSYCEIKDNYYYNNSFEFKKFRLLSDEKIDDDVVIHIDAELKNPDSFESDILDTSSYDIYVDGVYNKTVVGKTFTLKLKNGRTCYVYAVPLIANTLSDEILVGVPKEYVYVSQKFGNDTNDGLNRSTPVESIKKAIEIAKTKGNIVIMDGTFTENGLVIDYNLNIVGEGDVKFTGSSANTIFTVLNNSDFSISNIAFDSLVFSTRATGIIRQTEGYTSIDSCLFNSNYVSGLTGANLIEAKNIGIYNSNFTNHNKNKVYITLIKSDEFLIDNCTFKNNVASYTGYTSLITTAGAATGVKGTISGSVFKSNTVMYGCIYFGASTAPLTITNTKFIANKVSTTNAHASCIKLETSPTLKIDSSFFMNNVDLGDKSAVIYVSRDSASVFVSNSIILNNTYKNTNNLVFSASTANNLNAYKNLDGNWWGNTWQNYDVAPPAPVSACNNWVVLNITTNTTDLAIYQKALVSVDFFNVADRQGNLSFYYAGKLPEFDLDVDAVNGTLSSYKVNVIKGSGNVEYTLESLIRGSITFYYNEVHSTLKFVWTLIDARIDIDVEDIVYGNSSEIIIDVPNDIDENKIALVINNQSYEFNKKIIIPKLGVGKYLINLTYAGDDKYAFNNYKKVFEVKKASPQINIDVDDTYYGNPIKITLTTDTDVSGDISIKIGEIHDQKAISSGKAEFLLAGLIADNYTVEVGYSGNQNYLSKNLTSNFTVKKYASAIAISKGNVEIGKDVVLTFRVNNDASGNITVDVNGKKENVSISAGTATYTIKSISSGFYAVAATYNGDMKYLSSTNATEIDVGRLNATLNVEVGSITYGEDAIFTVFLNNDATGNVTVNIDGKDYVGVINHGRASLNISALSAGEKIAHITYSGDFIYLGCQTTQSFNITKAKPTLTIDVSDIKEGKVLNVQIRITNGVTGTLKIVTPKGSENADIPRTGFLTRSISDLSAGEYNISAIYDGDDNYLDVLTTEHFNVIAWNAPQWPNEGYDTKNSGKSPYSSDANGDVGWITAVDGDIIGNMVIDSEGKIYVSTYNSIYSINADGSINWIFKSDDIEGNFSGLANSRDMILSPKTGYKLFFINQTTGVALKNNIFQGSSFFTPIVDENANIYITSEYQTTTSNYGLVIIPYSLWEFNTAPIYINMGKSVPTAAPVLLNNDTVAIATEDGLKIFDIPSKSVINSFKVTTHVRPVISENIMYAIDEDSVVAVTPSGSIWKVKINGTAGDYLSVGGNGEIFSITKEGVLYEYSTGEEIFIYDFKNNVSQAILVGQNDILYVGCENGDFYSIDAGGNLLWKINMNESLSGRPVMDKNGVIYVISGNRIVAINNGILKDSNISANANDVSFGSDVKIEISLDVEATGKISLKINDTYANESIVENGHASFIISNLNAGNYTAEIAYLGDSRFKSQNIDVKFNVLKITPAIEVEDKNISVGEDLVFTISNLPTDGTNYILITGDIEDRFNITDGVCKIVVCDLENGTYSLNIQYPSSMNYNEVNRKITVNVDKTFINYSVESNNISCGENLIIKISDMPTDASGTITVTINDNTFSNNTSNGKATITIPDLSVGKYDAQIRYSNDGKYVSGSKTIVVEVTKTNVAMNVQTGDIKYGENLNVAVNLNRDATGTLTAMVDGEKYTVDVIGGKSVINIPKLGAGSHNIDLIYSGDDKYLPMNMSKIVKVPIVKLTGKDVSMLYTSGSYYKVYLTQDGSPLAGKTVVITINGNKYKRVSDSKGYASVKISLAPKTYAVTAVYDNLKVKNKVVVKNIINAKNLNAKKSSKSFKITVSLKKVNKKYLKGKKVTLKFNGKNYISKTNKKGVATFTIKKNVLKKLKVGKKYTYKVTYGKNVVSKKITVKK